MKANKLTKETINQLGVTQRSFPDFRVGDAIAVSQIIKEGNKERVQVFEGDVIAINNNGASTTFMVRRIAANSIPVERIFPLYSPFIESIKFLHHGRTRRSKLFYMRDRVGKASRVQERVLTREQKDQRTKHAAQEASSAE
jgi:large subunit ribosomal protein L19